MTKPLYNTATPYTAAFVILRRDGKVAFVLRSNTGWMDGNYGFPSGKVEPDETFSDCAVREAKEEVGVTVRKKDLKYVHTMHRKHDDSTWVDVFFEAIKWQGEPYNAEPEVHGEVVWLDPQKLPKNMVPPVRVALEEISKGRQYSEYGWEA